MLERLKTLAAIGRKPDSAKIVRVGFYQQIFEGVQSLTVEERRAYTKAADELAKRFTESLRQSEQPSVSESAAAPARCCP
jgi:hypothetical protein